VNYEVLSFILKKIKDNTSIKIKYFIFIFLVKFFMLLSVCEAKQD